MSTRLLYQVEKEASLITVRETRAVLLRLLKLKRMSESFSNKVCTAFSELASNVIQHSQPKANVFKLVVSLSESELLLTLEDDGGTWQGVEAVASVEALPFEAESGRGVALIHALADRVEYQGLALQGNRVQLAWRHETTPLKSKILIVEDEPIAQALYRHYLSDSYQVDVVMNGIEALKACQAHTYDLVLSDVHMPDMDGLALREQLLKRNENLLTPFIFLSGEGSDALIEQANGLGIEAFLRKPIDKATLRQSVERALYRTGQLKAAVSDQLSKRMRQSLLCFEPAQTPFWAIEQRSISSQLGGGDFFQSFELKDEDDQPVTLLLLADVEGHDQEAKFFAHAYAGYFRGVINSFIATIASNQPETKGWISRLEALIAELSKGIHLDNLLNQSTVTFLLITLHAGGRVAIVSGGHPPPFILGRGINPIPVGGILPGLIKDACYQGYDFKLGGGESLLLYTDGLFDSKMASGSCVSTQILPLLEGYSIQDLGRFATDLQESLLSLAEPSLRDDVSFILLSPKLFH